jgi:hypothetical protein
MRLAPDYAASRSKPCHLPSLRSFSRRSCPPRIPSLASRRPPYLHRRTELERCCLVDVAIKVHPTGLVLRHKSGGVVVYSSGPCSVRGDGC